jgi:hypothetical protein
LFSPVLLLVEGHDQQITVKDGRSAEAMLTVEFYVAILPENVPVVRRNCDHAAIAEYGVDAFAIGGGRGCRVGILAFLAQRCLF